MEKLPRRLKDHFTYSLEGISKIKLDPLCKKEMFHCWYLESPGVVWILDEISLSLKTTIKKTVGRLT